MSACGAVPAGGETPEEREYREALAALNKANADGQGVEDEWNNFSLLKEIAKLGLDFIAGDIIDCVKNPNFMDRLWAIVFQVPGTGDWIDAGGPVFGDELVTSGEQSVMVVDRHRYKRGMAR